MIRHSRRIVTLTVLALGLGASHAAQSQTAYALSGGGNTLVSFNLATPGVVTTVGSFANNLTLNDIDFRPANGFLYGYNQAARQIFTINTTTAATTLASTLSTGSPTGNTGIDFNPTVDRLRIVTANGDNLRVNVDTGATTTDANLSRTGVRDVAYTNSDNDPATGTTIYYIDSTLNTLATSGSPNGGVLTTVGNGLGVDPSDFSGFDIFTGAGANSAYAIIDSASGSGNPGLYTISLTSGTASLIGNFNLNVSGLAIDPSTAPAAVPEPGSIALLVGIATVGAGFVRKRRARK